MRPVKDAFASAISSAEKTLRGSGKSTGQETPKERGYAVTKLADARGKKRKEEAREFARLARLFGLKEDTLADVDAAAKAHTQSSENWIFVMISPAQNTAVMRWINTNSKRPQKAGLLWATLLEHLRMDTGEIMATRQELAERVEIESGNLTKIMTELASINAIRKEKQGRTVRYFLNPNIATHLPSIAARRAARENAGPLLTLMEGGQVDG